MVEKIAAIVVTYNRKELLLNCLNSLKAQTRILDKVIIIDNHSSDGTEEFLERNENFSLPQIKYIRLSENMGGAGGFHEGVKIGMLEGFDWLWLLDDDVEPLPDALENLLKYQNISKCIHPSKTYGNGEIIDWEQWLDPVLGIVVNYRNASFKNGKQWCPVNVGCFEGMLIHRDVVEKIGYPDKRFFICDDDTIYGFLASRYTNPIYVRDALVIRKIKMKNGAATNTQLYYSTRNYFLIKDYLKDLGFKTRYSMVSFLALTFRKILKEIFIRGSGKRVLIILTAIKDGLRGEFGKGIEPKPVRKNSLIG